jgi:hypothetical protein
MPIQGFTRFRKHQFGRQAAFATPVAATRAYPFKGTPTPNLNWTDPDIDVGSLDPEAPPYRVAPDLTAALTDPSLKYNNIPLLMSAIFGGAVDPTGAGAAKTWTHKPASTTPDDVDVYSYEFGDDVTSDWFQFGDGHLESLEITGPDGLGPLSTSMGWRFGSIFSSGSTDSPDVPAVPTAGLNVSQDDAIVYLKDIGIYIADTVAGLAAAQITDALHSYVLRVNQPWDEKRFANGDQTFDISALGRGARGIELGCTWAKTTDTVGIGSQSDRWLSDGVHNEYVRLVATSTVLIPTTATPYSWQVTMPARIYTRTEGEVGGNSVVVLTAHAYDEPTTFQGVFESVVVCDVDETDLGHMPS